MLEKLPQNWKLVEEFEGNFIYENEQKDFQVCIDNMGNTFPRYYIDFQQLSGLFIKIGFEDGVYSTHAFREPEAKLKAIEMMQFINDKRIIFENRLTL